MLTTQPLPPQTQLIEEETYDDVSQIHPPQLNRHLQPQPPQLIEEETYDDVSQIQPPPPNRHLQPRPSQLIEEETYDDVSQTQPQQPIEEDFYDDIGSATSNLNHTPIAPSTAVVQAPIKLEKCFENLPEDRFVAPYGLEKWLKDMIAANRHRLKTNPLDNSISNSLGDGTPPIEGNYIC